MITVEVRESFGGGAHLKDDLKDDLKEDSR